MNPRTAHSSTDSTEIPPQAEFRTVACVAGVSLERGLRFEEVVGYAAEPENVVWIDLRDPGPDELSMLMVEFGFHPLALEDVASGRERPKIDEFRNFLSMVAYAVIWSDDVHRFTTSQVDLFVGANYLVSVHRGAVPAIDEAMTRWTRSGAMLREGIGFLVYTVVDAIVDSYVPVMNAIEQMADRQNLELPEVDHGEGVEELIRLKRTLLGLRRILYPQREMFHAFLKHEQRYFTESTRVYMHDVYDHILRLLDVLDMELDLINGTLEAQLTLLSSRLNRTMKRLTVITVVVAIVGVIFGAWGMNVAHLPFGDSPLGFWLVCGCTLLLTGIFLFISWRQRWL